MINAPFLAHLDRVGDELAWQAMAAGAGCSHRVGDGMAGVRRVGEGDEGLEEGPCCLWWCVRHAVQLGASAHLTIHGAAASAWGHAMERAE